MSKTFRNLAGFGKRMEYYFIGQMFKVGDGALFSAIEHEPRDNYYFVFYSERLDCMWILSSAEFLAECVTNKNGKNVGRHSIWFNGCRMNRQTGLREEYCKPQFARYVCRDFSRFH